MSSPFGNYSNATLTVSTPGDTVEKIAGNWVPVETSETYQAILKPTRPKPNVLPGLDGASIYLSGYLTDPMVFPETVRLPARIPCVITMQNSITQEGIFEAQFLPSGGFGVEAITGQKIEGYLVIKDGN